MSFKTAILGGGRIPFQPSGTLYKNYMGYDLIKAAINGLFETVKIKPSLVDHVLVGNVIQEVKTSNVAREASLATNIPCTTPATTISQACISSSQCVTMGMNQIRSGQANLVLAGGVESFSDVPIRYPKIMRKWLMDFPKISKKGTSETLGHLSKLRPQYFKPEPPALANFTTGDLMGQASEKIAKRFGVSRQEQDEYTIRSHNLAYEAHKKGLYENEIFEIDGNKMENNIRPNQTLDKLAKLKPSFSKDGTHTAGNSTGLTDGATACLLSNGPVEGYQPLAYIVDSVFIGTDPYEELLLGPSYAISKLLSKNKVTLNDIGVFEIHEAFAGQILANIRALDQENFCARKLNRGKIGEIALDKLNLWGGSLAIGHPLAASNIRNIMTAVNRMHMENCELALVSACADSGLANAMLLSRSPM